MKQYAFLLVAALLGLPGHAALIEQQQAVPVSVVNAYGKKIERSIVVTIFYDDATPTPRPAIVLNHGRATTPEGRASLGRARFTAASGWLASRGFLVAVPTRIGYGVTGGEDIESSGRCDDERFGPSFAAAASQVVSVLDLLRQREDVQPQRLVVMGQSMGGGTTVAVAALNPPGVVAAINFAGGSGGNPETHPRRPCSPARLQRLYADYGRVAHIPTLWAYTENDLFWGDKIPRDWFAAFVAGGAPAEFHEFEPHGDNGHLLFAKFPEVWKPVVADYLRRQGFDFKD